MINGGDRGEKRKRKDKERRKKGEGIKERKGHNDKRLEGEIKRMWEIGEIIIIIRRGEKEEMRRTKGGYEESRIENI